MGPILMPLFELTFARPGDSFSPQPSLSLLLAPLVLDAAVLGDRAARAQDNYYQLK